MKKYFIGLVLSIYTLIGIEANACSCGEPPLAQNISSTYFIASGKILSSENLFNVWTPVTNNRKPDPFFYTHYKVLVKHVYKGLVTKNTIDVYTQNNGGDCGYDAKVGSDYIFFGSEKVFFEGLENYNLPRSEGNGDLSWIWLCSGTRDYSDGYSAAIDAILKP